MQVTGTLHHGEYVDHWRFLRPDGTVQTEGDAGKEGFDHLHCYDASSKPSHCSKDAKYDLMASPGIGTANDR